MSDITISSAVGRAAAFAVALVFVALIAWCSKSSPKYRRMTKADHCMGMPVHAGPTGPLIGYLIGGALVDPGSGPVQAIDVSVVVDGETRSVWRRQSDVMTWYVPVRAISPKDCVWTRSEEHTSELQSQSNLVCRLLLEKKKKRKETNTD